jgi:hypothetical protein
VHRQDDGPGDEVSLALVDFTSPPSALTPSSLAHRWFIRIILRGPLLPIFRLDALYAR